MRAPWLAGILLYGLLAGMLQFKTIHPQFFPVVLCITLLVVASCLAMLMGLWQLVNGPQRLYGFRLLTVPTIPLTLLAFHGSLAYANNDVEHRFASYQDHLLYPLAASLMDLEARFRYPVRTVGRKVVMMHDGIQDAEEQVRAMDLHVERIERLLGRPTIGKIHWVRGALLGRKGLSFWGMALGSTGTEQAQVSDGLTTLDRHEIAHGVIDSFADSYKREPPPILVEGWAESQSGYLTSQLYGKAARLRAARAPLRELILPVHAQFNSRIYEQGGVLVDYLLSRLGGQKFEAFYHDCSAETFDSDCRRHLDMSVDELDAAYSRHLDDMIANGTVLEHALKETRCGPGVDQRKWLEFVNKYLRTVYAADGAKADFKGRDFSFTSVHKNRSFDRPLEESVSECYYALSGPFACSSQRSLGSSQTLFLAKPSSATHLVRESPAKPWVAQAGGFSGENAYYDCMRQIREDAIGLLTPSCLSDFWNRVGAEEAMVTELEEFEDAGKPRLRVTIDFPIGPNGGTKRETTVAAVDQAYAPVDVEVQNNQSEASTVQIRLEYQQPHGRSILQRSSGQIKNAGGKLLREFSTEIKDFEIGSKPAKGFALDAFGVDESEIVQQPKTVVSQTNSKTIIPWFVGGWLIICIVSLFATARGQLDRSCSKPNKQGNEHCPA
jgi:hypothetical protein